MEEKLVVIGIALLFVVGLFFSNGGVQGLHGLTVLNPFTSVTLADNQQYWLGSWVCDGNGVGDGAFGIMSKGKTQAGQTIFERREGIEVGCQARQPYVRATLSERDSLKVGGVLLFVHDEIPGLGEKHAPFFFDVDTVSNTSVSSEYFYDTFDSPDSFPMPNGKGVTIAVQGQLEKGYVDPDLSNVLIFQGFDSGVCGSYSSYCNYQADRNDWQNVQITSAEQQSCNFPTSIGQNLFGATPSSVYASVQQFIATSGYPDSQKRAIADQYGAALKCWSVSHVPKGFASSVDYTGLKNPATGVSSPNKVHWGYAPKSFNSLIVITVPIAVANTWSYDLPSLQSCQLQTSGLTLNKVDADGSTFSINVKNVGGYNCQASVLWKTVSGFTQLSFFPNPVTATLSVGQEITFVTTVRSSLSTNDIQSQVCASVSQPQGTLPDVCGTVHTDTGGQPPVPTGTPISNPPLVCPDGFVPKVTENVDFLGQKTTSSSCVAASANAGNLDWMLIAEILAVLAAAYLVITGKVDLTGREVKEFIFPFLLGGVAWYILSSFSFFGNHVLAGFSLIGAGVVFLLVLFFENFGLV